MVESLVDDRPLSPLARYALKGLRNCWLPDLNLWSFIYHLDGRPQPNQSLPVGDVFYSLNVLLGLSRVGKPRALGYDIDMIFDRCARGLLELPMRPYAYGMAMWAAAESNRELSPALHHMIMGLLDKRNWKAFHAQDVAMLLIGMLRTQSSRDDRTQRASELLGFVRESFAAPSGLFYDCASGWRKGFASFASQIYLTLACYYYYEATEDERALNLANSCVRKLIDLQGSRGEWPWFYHVPAGNVVDFYEVYSIHQDGMAPAALQYAERYGVSGARDAMIRGFNWILGKNQLGVSMLRPDLGMIVRSQARIGELKFKGPRVFRSCLHAMTNTAGSLTDPSKVTLRLECRSYHLGWILWALAARDDVPEITHSPAFASTQKIGMTASSDWRR